MNIGFKIVMQQKVHMRFITVLLYILELTYQLKSFVCGVFSRNSGWVLTFRGSWYTAATGPQWLHQWSRPMHRFVKIPLSNRVSSCIWTVSLAPKETCGGRKSYARDYLISRPAYNIAPTKGGWGRLCVNCELFFIDATYLYGKDSWSRILSCK